VPRLRMGEAIPPLSIYTSLHDMHRDNFTLHLHMSLHLQPFNKIPLTFSVVPTHATQFHYAI